MQKHNPKQFLLLTIFMLSASWCAAFGTRFIDGYSNICVKENNVQGAPKSASIQASVSGHTLSVVFTENLGHVTVEVTTADNGAVVETTGLYTPNGACLYIPDAGSYVVTFTLPNGDEYYGEFEVID